MTMMTTPGLAPDAVGPAGRLALDLPADIRVGETVHPVRVTTLHATGVDLHLVDAAAVDAAFAEEVVVAIPALGQYRARRLRRNGTRAAYLFELTEFSRRALGALIADRFPGHARSDDT